MLRKDLWFPIGAGAAALVLCLLWLNSLKEVGELKGQVVSLQGQQSDATSRNAAAVASLEGQLNGVRADRATYMESLTRCQQEQAAVSQGGVTAQASATPAVDYNRLLRETLSTFGDAFLVAERSPKILGSSQLEKLQRLRKEAAGISWPSEIQQRADFALQGEDAYVGVYLKMLDGGSQESLDRELIVAKQYFIDAGRERPICCSRFTR